VCAARRRDNPVGLARFPNNSLRRRMLGVAHIDPVKMTVHVDGYGDMTEDVARELHAMRMAELDNVTAKVDARQRYLARECGEAVHFDGGTLIGQVDEAVYQHYVDRYGTQFWADKSNRNWFLKRHPECRVRSRAVNTTVRITTDYRVSDRRSSAHLLKEAAA
jgi:hypothetical protein